MAPYRYNLYCDESGIHEGERFYLGFIHCSPQRARRLDCAIHAFRVETGCVREMKWNKVSRSMLEAYKKFANVFLDDPYATFVLAEVTRGPYWRSLARNEGSRFLHALFHVIEKLMWASARYEVYLDSVACKRYKIRAMHYAMNLPRRKVVRLAMVDSHANSMVQLVDVVLGALKSSAKGEAKGECPRSSGLLDKIWCLKARGRKLAGAGGQKIQTEAVVRLTPALHRTLRCR